ncbi:MAG: ATP-binding protein [Myxococcales bacterium]|nr:ATP-binding protein [Myxococcales bacterium]
MKFLEVQVQRDHLSRVVARFAPLKALAELIWNALDGDATQVDVTVHAQQSLSCIESLRVTDNGHGIAYSVAESSFRDLGNSWKRGKKSPSGRRLHGERGEGRFAVIDRAN